ncbi:MAG: hypothetical protein M5R42_06570 [Rhodocyclaceae bacterium]|nr:hypothetical protein [Rhodocyclaceae bacterium]
MMKAGGLEVPQEAWLLADLRQARSEAARSPTRPAARSGRIWPARKELSEADMAGAVVGKIA